MGAHRSGPCHSLIPTSSADLQEGLGQRFRGIPSLPITPVHEIGESISPQAPAGQTGFRWQGTVPPQKWMSFYTKVLSPFAMGQGLRLTVKVEANPPGGLTNNQLTNTRMALRDLGLGEEVERGGE